MNKVVFLSEKEKMEEVLKPLLTSGDYDRVFILCDENTHEKCLPVLLSLPCLEGAGEIVVPAGDDNKDLRSSCLVWEGLERGGAMRRSLLVNVGGGMVTDLGGWCASCFKRGIDFLNIPTTLLAMVDASLGGKTGVNFHGLKNELGLFREPILTLVHTPFLATLDRENLLAGYAEMMKHGLLSDSTTLGELLSVDFDQLDLTLLSTLIEKSVDVKRHVVEQDPLENGKRKALNFGHTIGHALEALSLKKGSPLLHGYAVAHGMVGELYLSVMKVDFPVRKMRQMVSVIRALYGAPSVTCDDYAELIHMMSHDKKNTQGQINFTLLRDVGDISINQTASEDEIKEALDFLREGL